MFLGHEFNNRSKQGVHIHRVRFHILLPDQHGSLAVIEYPVVDENGVVVRGLRRFRRGECEIEDVLEGALVAQLSGRRLGVDSEARRWVVVTRHKRIGYVIFDIWCWIFWTCGDWEIFRWPCETAMVKVKVMVSG